MEKIESFDKTDIDDKFSSEITYINTIFELKDKDKDEDIELCNEDNYKEKSSKFFNNINVLDSIYDLGKNFYEFLNVQHLDEIDGILVKSHKDELQKIIYEWIKCNDYPYDYFATDYLTLFIEIIRDSIECYTIYELNKWIFKLQHFKDNDEEIHNEKGEIDYDIILPCYKNVKNWLTFINFDIKDISNISKIILNVSTYEDEADPNQFILSYEDFYYNVIKVNNVSDVDINYCDSIRAYAISYLLQKINTKNFKISKQIPVYYVESSQFRLFNTANSIMSIAYNRLLLNLTASEKSYIRKICANPKCNNEFESKKRRKYCEDIICQRARHAKNSNNSYHRHTKQKEKANQID